MPPRPATPYCTLRGAMPRGLVLRGMALWGAVLGLAMLLGAALAPREALLRLRLAMLPWGHRRRQRLERELAKLARVRALLEDPAFWADARTIGKAAEVARCAGDAGRRALARRWGLLGTRGRGMRPVARAATAADRVAGGRCSGFRYAA